MKMKLTFGVLAAFGLIFSQGALADGGLKSDLKGTGTYGSAGCGLGSMAFKSDSKSSQVFAATTNGTFGNQTFGISSGTSNCTSSGLTKIDKETEMFVEVNMDRLQSDIAKGQGETLESFASLVGCTETSSFNSALQSDFEDLSSAQDSNDFLNKVSNLISEDQELSKSCTNNS